MKAPSWARRLPKTNRQGATPHAGRGTGGPSASTWRNRSTTSAASSSGPMRGNHRARGALEKGQPAAQEDTTMKLMSTSFKDGDYLGKDHVLSTDYGFGCDGGNKSPHLR